MGVLEPLFHHLIGAFRFLTATLTQINSSLEELDEELGALPRGSQG